VTVAEIVKPSTETEVTTAVGIGPVPFSKVTVAPVWNPEPVMVTAIVVPRHF
jgi:hypothetical protein